MQIQEFALERYFARHEFSARLLLSPSDCETLSQQDLLGLADNQTLDLWQNLRLGYTESAGHPLLRAEIAALYAGLNAEDIFTAVPEEAIFLAMHALLQPGDRVIVLWPAYQSLYSVAHSLGCAVDPWPLRLGATGWELDMNRLETLLPGARLLVINFPHNPTGFLPGQDQFERILAMAERHGVFIFCDEMYRLLENSREDRLPPACERMSRAVCLSGLSKAFGLPGLRVGWLASRDAGLLARCQSLKDYTTICGSAPAEILAIIALRAKSTIVDRCVRLITANRVRMDNFCARHSAFIDWIPPQAGSTAFPRWIGPGTVEDLCERALQQEGLMIVPGSMFSNPGPHFRIGLGRENFPEALAAFENLLV